MIGKNLFKVPGKGYARREKVFCFLPRRLPLVDRLGNWDGRTYKFIWWRTVWMFGYSISGWVAIIDGVD